jgi:hypothetical protein
VFGGVERESGRTFLVPVPDRTADILVNVIRAWIEPGTTIISECWAAYRDIRSLGYTHCTVNYSVSSVNLDTWDYTNTIESMWRAVKDFLRPYNRRQDYEYHLAHYMFAARCKAQGFLSSNNCLQSSRPPTGPPALLQQRTARAPRGLPHRSYPRLISRTRRYLGTQVCARTYYSISLRFTQLLSAFTSIIRGHR